MVLNAHNPYQHTRALIKDECGNPCLRCIIETLMIRHTTYLAQREICVKQLLLTWHHEN